MWDIKVREAQRNISSLDQRYKSHKDGILRLSDLKRVFVARYESHVRTCEVALQKLYFRYIKS